VKASPPPAAKAAKADCTGGRRIEAGLNRIRQRAREEPGYLDSREAEDVHSFVEAELVAAIGDAGYKLLGISWQPEIAEGIRSAHEVKTMFARECERLGLDVEVECCPHAAGPPQCWCRKPLPGLGVLFVKRHRLDPGQCIYVGTGPHDSGFARRLGFTFRDAGELAVLGNGDNTAV